MKFYESGDNRKPVIFLFPGTCCLYSSFDHVLDGLHSYFYTVTVSYDGFDPNEKTEFYSMEDECEKIEQEIRKKYGGRIYLVAKIQSSMVVPFMYKMVHTGTLPKFVQKKLDKTDGGRKELYNGFLNMFGIGKGGSPWITKQSIYNQFYSDLSSVELMCLEQRSMCFTQPRWEKNTKRDIVLISKIRISGSTICSMKNCFSVIVQSGWKK